MPLPPRTGEPEHFARALVAPRLALDVLDTGSRAFAPWLENGPKLVEVDPATDKVVRVLRLDPAAINPTTHLNDVRFDFSRGTAGYAYLTDSQPEGALIVVDLGSGESWARLRGHATTAATAGFRAVVQGVVRENYQVGADGIAISADGSLLYYCPLSGRRLYSVETSALIDRSLDDDQVAPTIVDLGDKGASDGLESDTDGGVYAMAYEHSAVLRRDADGSWSTVLHAPALLWPDTLALAGNGFLYVSVNQLPRTPLFNNGIDTRVSPYQIVRVHVGAGRIRLTGAAWEPSDGSGLLGSGELLEEELVLEERHVVLMSGLGRQGCAVWKSRHPAFSVAAQVGELAGPVLG